MASEAAVSLCSPSYSLPPSPPDVSADTAAPALRRDLLLRTRSRYKGLMTLAKQLLSSAPHACFRFEILNFLINTPRSYTLLDTPAVLCPALRRTRRPTAANGALKAVQERTELERQRSDVNHKRSVLIFFHLE